MVCVLSPCLSLTEQQRHLLQQQEQQLQQLQQLLASPQLSPVMPAPGPPTPGCSSSVGWARVRGWASLGRAGIEGSEGEGGQPQAGPLSGVWGQRG